MILLRSFPTVLSVLGLLILGGCITNSALEASRKFASVGDYKHAFEELDSERTRQLEAGGVDEVLETAYQSIRLEYLRDRAQQRIFTEREDMALDDLDLIAATDPDYPGLKRLRCMAFTKKANRIVDLANEKLSQKDFLAAMKGYIASQVLVAGFEPANDGIRKVRDEMARLSARAQQQFLQAVRKVPDFRHIEVAWHAAAVIHLTPDESDERRVEAAELRTAARKESAQATFARAKACEDGNQFGAARVLYLEARRLHPTIEGVEAAVDKMDQELKALGMLERAQVQMRNERFDEADQLLADAHKLSAYSRGAISELMMASRRLRGKMQYRHALDFEVMGKKIEALAAFKALAKAWPAGLEDEAARVDGLQIDVDSAKTEWQAAEKAEADGDLVKALDHYLTAERFYSEWRDGEVHIARLRKAIAAQAVEEASGGTPPAGGGE